MSEPKGFAIYSGSGRKRRAVLSGWGFKKDVEAAFKAISKIRMGEILELEW